MAVTAIRDPLDGEQLIAADPPPAPRVSPGWRRRLRSFPGRSLSHDALTLEQSHRTGHLAVLGQTLSAGVVRGLEAGLEELPEDDSVPSEAAVVQVAPGYGLTDGGEDVVVPRPLRSPLGELRVRAPALWLATGNLPDPVAGQLAPRSLGPTLSELLDPAAEVPWAAGVPPAAVLVLQPIEGESSGAVDPADACERDPESEAFEDRLRLDGVRLILDLWPREWLSLPLPGPQLRNRVAHTIFERERELAGEVMPWHQVGLPIALLYQDLPDTTWRADRYSVVRAGGRPRARRPVVAGAGDRFLRRARVEQLAEHLAELRESGAEVRALEHFQHLPPAGILAPEAVDFDWQEGFRSTFFPSSWHLVASPLPLAELDAALGESAALVPLATSPSDVPRVEVLVPVPDELYDPRLLVREEVDPEFPETIGRLLERRGELRQRRDDVRGKLDPLARACDGERVSYPSDPADEEAAAGPLDPQEEAYGTELEGTTLVVRAVEELTSSLADDPVLRNEPLESIGRDGLESFVEQLEEKVKRADGKIDLGFASVQTDIYRIRQMVLGATAATRLATSQTLASIAQGTSAVATKRQLRDFLDALESSPAGAGDDPDPAAEPGHGAAESPAETGLLDGAGILAGDVERSADGTDFAASVYDVPAASEVVEQAPVVGQPLRTTTVGERLREPAAPEARNFAVANRYEVVRGLEELSDLGLSLDDLPIPGVPFAADGRPLPPDPRTGLPARTTLTFSQVMPHRSRLLDDPDPVTTGESGYFNVAVQLADDTVALLRHLEGHAYKLRMALARARRVLKTVKAFRSRAAARLDAVDSGLAEARHDVEVARSLADEEQSRADALNARRRRIVSDQVRFLAFRRLRSVDLLLDAPARRLEPALAEDPEVVCLAPPIEVPAELQAMIELFREAPLRWFRGLPEILDRLDRPALLYAALSESRQRAGQATGPAPGVPGSPAARDPLGESLVRTLDASRRRVDKERAALAGLDLAGLADASWLDVRREAERLLAPRDLLAAGLGRPPVVRRVARELDQIARLGACLYAGLGDVPASIRLDWAERLSRFDRPVDLAELSRLPRWQEIESTERRQLQGLVDAIYHRLDHRRQGALALGYELVLVCIVTASHAPVNRLIPGQVEEQAMLRQGGQVKVRVEELADVRIGMPAMFFAAGKTVARGEVENLVGGLATARVTETFADRIQLAAGGRVALAETRAFERRGLGSRNSSRCGRRSFSEMS